MSAKVDFKKTMERYRARSGRFDRLDVPATTYLMVDGAGDPSTAPAFTAAIETLYPVAYTLKFHSKDTYGRDYVVPPLESLWWAEDMTAFTTARDKTQWQWTLMLMVPGWLTADDIDVAITAARRKAEKKGRALPLIGSLREGELAEGTCFQTLHIGSFDDKAGVLAELHESVIPAAGMKTRRPAPRDLPIGLPAHGTAAPPDHPAPAGQLILVSTASGAVSAAGGPKVGSGR